MIKNCCLSIFVIFTSANIFAQSSKSEITGFWEQTSSWVGGTMPGSVTGGTITASAKTIVIDGTVKTHNNLTITAISALTINAGDTLVVFGNLTVSGVSGLTNNGVLMVTGNVNNTLSGVTNSATGKMVVMGNYNNSTGVVNTFTGPTYVYGSDNGFLFAPSTSSQATMATNDPALDTYVNWMYGVLPIHLVSFSGELNNFRAVLTWTTSGEFNNDHFMLERSLDKNNFETITTMPGALYSKELKTYSFTDGEPLVGTSYYRLSQIDTDGTLTRLSIVSIENEQAVSIQIYPNPTTEYLFITGAQENDAVSIKDAEGSHQSIQYPLSEVVPGKKGIKISDLDPGVYCIHITSSLQNTSKSFRFVKR